MITSRHKRRNSHKSEQTKETETCVTITAKNFSCDRLEIENMQSGGTEKVSQSTRSCHSSLLDSEQNNKRNIGNKFSGMFSHVREEKKTLCICTFFRAIVVNFEDKQRSEEKLDLYESYCRLGDKTEKLHKK